jgi:hypothetical protein
VAFYIADNSCVDARNSHEQKLLSCDQQKQGLVGLATCPVVGIEIQATLQGAGLAVRVSCPCYEPYSFFRFSLLEKADRDA